MTRAYALLCTVIFLIVGLVGLAVVIGATATHLHAGQAEGNLGSVTLHLTWTREVLDLVLLGLFGYIWLFAKGGVGRVLMGVIGLVLLVLGVFGTIHGDNARASMAVAGLNFPTLINVFDIVIGLIGIIVPFGPTADS